MKGYCKCSEHLENNVSSWNYTKVVAGIANFVHEMHHTGVTHCYKKSVLTLFFSNNAPLQGFWTQCKLLLSDHISSTTAQVKHEAKETRVSSRNMQ